MSVTPEDPRVRFAAERTLLAWIRTGLAMMGFGFVVARFGLFLREMAAMGQGPAPSGWSQAVGVGLIGLGVVVNVLAAAEHRRVIADIDRGAPYTPPRWSLATLVAVLLAGLGVAMAASMLRM